MIETNAKMPKSLFHPGYSEISNLTFLNLINKNGIKQVVRFRVSQSGRAKLQQDSPAVCNLETLSHRQSSSYSLKQKVSVRILAQALVESFRAFLLGFSFGSSFGFRWISKLVTPYRRSPTSLQTRENLSFGELKIEFRLLTISSICMGRLKS